MTTDEALSFLQAHQPMPSDFDIADEEGAIFAQILEHFQECLDERCLPLLIHSVSSHTGLGMYEHIKFVLMAHPREQVIPYLRDALVHGTVAVKYRCCWWATDIDAWDVEDRIAPLAHHPDMDVRDAADAFMELKQMLS